MIDRDRGELLAAFDVERVNEGYRAFLELIAKDVVDMDFSWRNVNEDDKSGEVFKNSLMAQLAFVYKVIYRTSIRKNVFAPTYGPMKWRGYTFALLYDICFAEKLIHKDHPEEDFHIQDAYDDGLFVGWQVRFFKNLDQVERFIRKHSEFNSYALYYNGKKIPIKYGFYLPEDKEKKQRHYCRELEFWQHKNNFIAFEGFFEIRLATAFFPYLPRTYKVYSEEYALLDLAIDYAKYYRSFFHELPTGEVKESSYVKVTFSDGVNKAEGIILRHPEKIDQFEFIQDKELIQKIEESEAHLKIRLHEVPKEEN